MKLYSRGVKDDNLSGGSVDRDRFMREHRGDDLLGCVSASCSR
eukprot:SAG31_NODE_14364_length_811_cov_1.091292_1_plen_42_part_10